MPRRCRGTDKRTHEAAPGGKVGRQTAGFHDLDQLNHVFQCSHGGRESELQKRLEDVRRRHRWLFQVLALRLDSRTDRARAEIEEVAGSSSIHLRFRAAWKLE